MADRLPGYDPGGSRRELEVLDVLRRGGLPAPVQQYEVVVGGRRRFLDYAYPDERVGLEFDGFAEHGMVRSTFDDDRVRGNDLAVAGWLMLHFTSRSSPAHVIERMAEALSLRRRQPANGGASGRQAPCSTRRFSRRRLRRHTAASTGPVSDHGNTRCSSQVKRV